MNLVLVPKAWGGVEYHRLIIPFKNIPDTQITPSFEDVTEKDLKDHNITQVWFNRNLSEKYDPLPIVAKLKRSGVKMVIDIDDYWNVPFGHVLNKVWKESNLARLYSDQIQIADYVCVTHQKLADTIIRELGVSPKKIIIAPNAIDPNEDQYTKRYIYNLENLFWQGSITHFHDLKQLSQTINNLELDFTFTIAGYNKLSNEAWDKQFELFKIGTRLRKIEAKPTYEYMSVYEGMGICLIPLENNKFNTHKSNLKMLEAGWAEKPVIVSGIHPYNTLAKDKVNCLTAYTPKAWDNAIRTLLSNPNQANDIRHRLNEDIKAAYTIDKVNNVRIDLINHLNK